MKGHLSRRRPDQTSSVKLRAPPLAGCEHGLDLKQFEAGSASLTKRAVGARPDPTASRSSRGGWLLTAFLPMRVFLTAKAEREHGSAVSGSAKKMCLDPATLKGYFFVWGSH